MARIMFESTPANSRGLLLIHTKMTPLRQVAYFARAFFDSSFFIVQEKSGDIATKAAGEPKS
jgi:hypothetical protein